MANGPGTGIAAWDFQHASLFAAPEDRPSAQSHRELRGSRGYQRRSVKSGAERVAGFHHLNTPTGLAQLAK